MGKTQYLQTWILSAWLLSLLIVVLTTFTPMEFVPLPLANGPRWLSWGLAFPACRLLQTRWGTFRWLWAAVPWLLWGPLLVSQGVWLLLALGQTQPLTWSSALEPVRTLFLQEKSWHTHRVLFRRGRQVVVTQRLLPQPTSFHSRFARTVQLTPLLPGLQWTAPVQSKGVLDASWRFVDTLHKDEQSVAAIQLSRDSAVHWWLRPWIRARHRAFEHKQRTLFRQSLGPQRPDTVEQLPAATRHGANTLGCVLSALGPATPAGLRLRPTVRQGHGCQARFEPGSIDSYVPANTLSVNAELLIHGIAHPFHFRLTGVHGVGTYRLPGCWRPNEWRSMQLFDPWNYAQYCSGACPEATVTITYWSPKQRIVAGIFEGTLQTGTQGQQMATVCDGRFDLRYELMDESKTSGE